jgi:hypothetical protein
MSMIFIEIKFDIDINNDELLIIIWEHNKKEKSSLVVHSTVEPMCIYIYIYTHTHTHTLCSYMDEYS